MKGTKTPDDVYCNLTWEPYSTCSSTAGPRLTLARSQDIRMPPTSMQRDQDRAVKSPSKIRNRSQIGNRSQIPGGDESRVSRPSAIRESPKRTSSIADLLSPPFLQPSALFRRFHHGPASHAPKTTTVQHSLRQTASCQDSWRKTCRTPHQKACGESWFFVDFSSHSAPECEC